ncbi:MAG: hypothetical protein HRT95_09530 [Moritella sp.]|uniref:HEPN domain-containing protein n=1 Tax=Moritella sp. TaxID=78556 RepID=UPI001D6CDC53|nr:HEPN domain-containing protein [Moritella sp.]NQZ50400.1 hypothetical protein [Moritella sp.]
MARDYLKEIKLKYHNLYKDKERWEQLSLRVDPLLESIDAIKNIDSQDIRDELLRGSIIGIVSCIEGYIRLAVKDIIDFGEPFSTNSELISVNKQVKRHIANDSAVSKGDLIAHSVRLNTISDIDSLLSCVLGIDFWPSIQINNVLDDESLTLAEYNPDLFDDLERLFSFRHMFAHELASDVYIEIDDVDYFVSAGFLFMHVTEEMIDTCLFGD